MALSLINNTAALNAGNNLTKTNSMLGKSLERLSSGLKVNRGADGPAALVISEKQRAQITGLKTAIDNTNKAVSLVQTGEGAMNEINSLLGKARGLALDSANGGVNDTDSYAANQAELNNIVSTVNNIANQTQFGKKKLLDGSGDSQALTTSTAGASFTGRAGAALTASSYTFNVTTAAKETQQTGTTNFSVTAGGNFRIVTGGKTIDTGLVIGDTSATAASKINAALSGAGVTNIQATDGFNGANTGKLYLTATDFTTDFTTSAQGGLTNGAVTDFAYGAGTHTNAVVGYTDSTGNAVSVTGTGNKVDFGGELNGVSLTLGQSGTSINSIGGAVAASPGQAFVFQIGANQNQTASINFRSMLAGGLGVVGSNNLSNIKVDSATNAQTALASIDQAISDVANTRGSLGAFQANTLEVNANNLRVGLENTTAAESTIRDTDFATEIANFTKQQTLMQAGSTVLGNANQITQLVSGLLRG